jgi:hypothetical protein
MIAVGVIFLDDQPHEEGNMKKLNTLCKSSPSVLLVGNNKPLISPTAIIRINNNSTTTVVDDDIMVIESLTT